MTAILSTLAKFLASKDTITLVIKGVQMGIKIGNIFKVISLVSAIQAEVSKVLADGKLTVDEAEAEAVRLLGSEDFKFKMNGTDVLDAKAQEYLVRGFARLLATAAASRFV
jgi:hypothetical protein